MTEKEFNNLWQMDYEEALNLARAKGLITEDPVIKAKNLIKDYLKDNKDPCKIILSCQDAINYLEEK